LRQLLTSLDSRIPEAMLSLLSDEGNSIRRLAARAIGSRWWQIPKEKTESYLNALQHNLRSEIDFEDEKNMGHRLAITAAATAANTVWCHASYPCSFDYAGRLIASGAAISVCHSAAICRRWRTFPFDKTADGIRIASQIERFFLLDLARLSAKSVPNPRHESCSASIWPCIRSSICFASVSISVPNLSLQTESTFQFLFRSTDSCNGCMISE